MEYLGIVWLTSCLMELFSSSKVLFTASEYVDKRSAREVLLVTDKSIRKSDRAQKSRPERDPKSDRRKPSSDSVATVAIDRRWLEQLWQSLNSKTSKKSDFCRVPEEIPPHTQFTSLFPVLASLDASSASALPIPPILHGDDPTDTILQWMEEILPFYTADESMISPGDPTVQVVQINRPNSDSESTIDYQLWLEGCLIGTMPHPVSAYAIAFQLQQLLQNPNFDPRTIEAKMIEDKPAVHVGSQMLFVVDAKLSQQLDRHPKTIALEWINNLRQALDTPPLTLAETQAQMYGLVETEEELSGLASWYGPYFHGRLTANGEIYNQYDLTAAHPSLPFDTYLKVTNLYNGKSVIVRINDRGPYIPPRSLDLSLGAARQLGSEDTGVVQYKATIMKPERGSNLISDSAS